MWCFLGGAERDCIDCFWYNTPRYRLVRRSQAHNLRGVLHAVPQRSHRRSSQSPSSICLVQLARISHTRIQRSRNPPCRNPVCAALLEDNCSRQDTQYSRRYWSSSYQHEHVALVTQDVHFPERYSASKNC